VTCNRRLAELLGVHREEILARLAAREAPAPLFHTRTPIHAHPHGYTRARTHTDGRRNAHLASIYIPQGCMASTSQTTGEGGAGQNCKPGLRSQEAARP
jgi:hypothetical protein